MCKYFFLLLLLQGCFTTYNYDYKILKPEPTNTMKWQNDKISVDFTINDEDISFKLSNKTKEMMRIIWDEASIVIDSNAKRLIHSGIRFMEKEASQPPTTIPPNSTINDRILPSENVFYGEQSHQWLTKSLFKARNKGMVFSVYLPVQYQNNIIGYNFEFVLNEITEIK